MWIMSEPLFYVYSVLRERARARVTLGRIQTILLETWQQFVALTKEMLREANISL